MMTETVSVGFIGAIGSHTEEALVSTFKSPSLTSLQCQPVPFTSLTDLIEALQKAQINYVFLPIENSITGSFHHYLEAIGQQNLYINGEFVNMEHNVLWANPGVAIADIKEVRSHPTLLSQCTKFLHTLPPQTTISQYIDSASVAKTISETKSKTLAGIGSRRAANIYGLSILSDKVQDVPNVFTRYVLVGLKPAPSSMLERHMHPKTSLRLCLKNRVGEFAKVVNAVSMRDINISKIESSPSSRSINPSAPWEYHLYLDITGSIRETPIENCLKHLSEFAEVQVLGSYPQFRPEASAFPTSDAAAFLAPVGL